MTPLLVTVAPNGARRTKADHPNLPVSPEEIAAEAVRCYAAGASVLHLHVRAADGSHTLDPQRYLAAILAVRAAVGERMVVQITTEALDRYPPEAQMAAVREVRPEAVSLGVTELIPDDRAPHQAAEFLDWLRVRRIAPQFILYSPLEVTRFHSLRRRRVIPQERPYVLFVLGRHVDPVEVRPRDVLAFLKAHDQDCPWAVCAFGANEAACVLTAAGLGGHVRVGFENNLLLSSGRPAPSNVELVEQVVAGATLMGRTIADIEATRALLAASAI